MDIPSVYYKSKKLPKSSDELFVERMYDKLLKLFVKFIPNHSGTYADDLDKFGKGILKQFRGVFTRDQIKDLHLNSGDSLVVNVDTSNQSGSHWCGLYTLNPNYHLFYDSFGRNYKVLMKKSLDNLHTVANTDITDREQKINEVTCGERSLVFLFICENMGVEYAKLL